MKVQITSIALAVLAGAITASGQPQERRQKPQRRPEAAYGQQQQRCPVCGAIQRKGSQQGRRGQRQKAYGQQPRQDPGMNRQFAPQQRRGQQQFQPRGQQQFQPREQQPSRKLSPEQRQRIQQMRQKMLERYDRDGDGRLSERERNAIKRAPRESDREPKKDAPKKNKKGVQQHKR